MSRIISIIAFIVLLILLIILFRQCSPRQEVTKQGSVDNYPLAPEGIIRRPDHSREQVTKPPQDTDKKTQNSPETKSSTTNKIETKTEKGTLITNEKIKKAVHVSPSDAVANAAKKAQKDSEKISKQDPYIILQGVNFRFGSATLSPEASLQLKKIVKRLKNKPNLMVEIAGYADSTEDKGLNKNISQLRSETVMDYIVSNDIKANRLIAKGYSSNTPIADNANAEGRKQNRRVEIHIKLGS